MSNTRKHTRMRALHLSIKGIEPLKDFPSILKKMNDYKHLVFLKRSMKSKHNRKMLTLEIYKTKRLLGIIRDPNKICCVRYTDDVTLEGGGSLLVHLKRHQLEYEKPRVITEKRLNIYPGTSDGGVADSVTHVASKCRFSVDSCNDFVSVICKNMLNSIDVPSVILGYDGIPDRAFTMRGEVHSNEKN